MVVRKRYYYWLFKAYLKRWGKIIIASVFLGVFVFIFLFLLITNFFLSSFSNEIKRIGIAGSFTSTSLPDEVLKLVSYGLTIVSKDQSIEEGAAQFWEISNDGKRYTFKLKKGLILSNKKELTVDMLPYKYKDVTVKIIDPYTIEYTLKDAFAPFLSVVEKPILINNAGLGKYKIIKTSQESGFIKSITLQKRNSNEKIIYYFYPTNDALDTAFKLGEIDMAIGISHRLKPHETYKNWGKTKLKKETDYTRLVSLFFNTSDDSLGNKRVRQALTYVLPEKFNEGERTYSYIPPTSLYYAKSPNEGIYNVDLAKSLIEASASANLSFEITTSEELKIVAEKIKKEWEKIGVSSQIKITSGVPTTFQILLYSMSLPKDPDMYALWHTGQPGNISNYSNVRIDKLLEEGRQTVNIEERRTIYADIQKYLIDDSPTAFLYFPYRYTVKKEK